MNAHNFESIFQYLMSNYMLYFYKPRDEIQLYVKIYLFLPFKEQNRQQLKQSILHSQLKFCILVIIGHITFTFTRFWYNDTIDVVMVDIYCIVTIL